MTGFVKENFKYSGGYLTYVFNGEEKFVARFKRNKKDKPGFVAFLTENIVVEEYFTRLEAGDTPYEILKGYGYVSKTVQDVRKAAENTDRQLSYLGLT